MQAVAMRIGEVAQRADRLRELADRRLPEIDALIERAQRVRAWLATAQSCGCDAIDDCELFDNAAPLPAGPVKRGVHHVGGMPA